MRASCELCHGLQPLDWRAGDICVHCGKAARREVRCFWCVAWVPAGGFCRQCGAAIVDPKVFGAARMLKDAGVDRFSLPRMLQEMDPDQRENLGRIYERQAAIVAAHADHAAFLQRFLHHKHWSTALEDALTEQLPWTPELLRTMDTHGPVYAEDVPRAKNLAEHSPLEQIRQLAAIARLQLEQWDAWNDVYSLLHAPDASLRAEAALALTSWRTRYGVTSDAARSLPKRELIAELQNSPFPVRATLRIGLLGEKIDIPPEAIGSEDNDIAIAAALLKPDVDQLVAALQGDPLQRLTAGTKLAALGYLTPLNQVLRESSDEVVLRILDEAIYAKKSSPDLHDTLLHLIETSKHRVIPDKAAELLIRAPQPGDGFRLIRLTKGHSRILHTLLVRGKFPPEEFERIFEYLIDNGQFSADQFGMQTAAEKGIVSDGFVPRIFPRTPESMRPDLVRFAEAQIRESNEDLLVGFLMNVAYGAYPASLRHTAFGGIIRWNLRRGVHGRNRVPLNTETANRFFGSVGAYTSKLAKVILDIETYEDSSMREEIEHVLYYADTDSLATDPDAAFQLAGAVMRMMRDDRIAFHVRRAGADYLWAMGRHPAWRDKIAVHLQSFQATDLEHGCNEILERISRSTND